MKNYLRIDFDDDDSIIQAMMIAAETYLHNAGVRKQRGNELYNVVVMMLTSLFYENRAPVDAIPSTLNNLIIQLAVSGKKGCT